MTIRVLIVDDQAMVREGFGALLAARREQPRLRLVILAALAFGVAEILIALMPTYLAFVAVTPLIGITAMTTITSANTFVQTTVPGALRGRVMALYLMVFMGGTPFGSPLVGWVGETFGARWSLIGGGVPFLGTFMFNSIYKFAAYRFDLTTAFTNKAWTDAYRGAGRPEATFGIERMMDELAVELGREPLELRQQNWITHEEFPFTTVCGMTYDSGNYEAATDKAKRVAADSAPARPSSSVMIAAYCAGSVATATRA